MNSTLTCEGSYPSKETAAKLFDEFDYQAAVQAYVWSTTLVNSMAFWKALQRDLGFAPGELAIAVWDHRMKPQHIVMTANTEVVYGWSQFLNVTQIGPLVVQVPPGVRGHMFDLMQRALADIGDVGPDKGEGGKFLVLPPGHAGKVPEGHFPVRLQHSDHVMFGWRTFVAPQTGGLEGAVELAQKARVYPLSEQSLPKPNRFVLVGDKRFNSDWPKDKRYFSLLADAINADRIPETGLAILGNLRRLGIEKGRPFKPDARAQAILERAADTGHAMVRAMAFDNRFDKKFVYPDRQWEVGWHCSSQFLTGHYEEVEERAAGWYKLVGNFVVAMEPAPGTGQFPLATFRDSKSEYLNGSHAYRLRFPPRVPVKQFWQVPIYDAETRSLIDTDQKRCSVTSTEELLQNPDGSVDVYMGPEAPKGMEKNWVKTIPGKGWFTLLRLYGPLEPILNKTWKPNDFERVQLK